MRRAAAAALAPARFRAASTTHHPHPPHPVPRTASELAAGRAAIGVFTPVTASLWIARLQREAEATLPPAPRTGPVPPAPLDVRYPFSTSPQLRELYRNPWGAVRLGRVLEDLDSMAGSIALAHADGGDPRTRPPLLVTAAVDAIWVARLLAVDKGDLLARGQVGGRGGEAGRTVSARARVPVPDAARPSSQVVHTGSSSLDIRIELGEAPAAGAGKAAASLDPALVALFTFACRDPTTGAPMPVPALAPRTPWEKRVAAERGAVAAARRAARAAAGGAPPPPEVAAAASLLLTEARDAADLPSLASPDAVPGAATARSNLFTCQPQHRNLAGRVFGGFLMRRAFELAFAAAYAFAGRRPALAGVEEVSFLSPVSVGDLLRLTSRVLHAGPMPGDAARGAVVVAVDAHVVRPERGDTARSNTFVFQYSVALAPGDGGPALKRALPSSDADALAAAEYVVAAGRGGGL